MAHAQNPDFVFRPNGRALLNRPGGGGGGGVQFSRLLVAEVCASVVVMLDTPCSEVVWRVLATHCIRQFLPSLPLLCVTVCHHISTGVYLSYRQGKVLLTVNMKLKYASFWKYTHWTYRLFHYNGSTVMWESDRRLTKYETLNNLWNVLVFRYAENKRKLDTVN